MEFQAVEKTGAIIYRFPVSNLAEKRHSVTDEAGATPETGDAAQQGGAKEPPLAFLRVGKTVLTDADLASPATRRFMIAEIERLEGVCAELKQTEKAYYGLRETHAAVVESRKSSKLLDIASAVCLAVGSAGLGAAPSYQPPNNTSSFGLIFIVGSALLVLASVGVIAAQVIRK